MTIPSPRSLRRARIEIIPLIDIIFFLLATFVMVSLSMVRINGMPVALAAARTATSLGSGDATTITIRKDGSLFFDKEQVALENLPERFTALMQLYHGDPVVRIAGDEDSRLGDALHVLDECRQAGIARVAFQTRPVQ